MFIKNNRKAFTLVELVVVVAIIGILVLLATPKLMDYTKEAKLAQIKNDIKVVETVLDEYLMKNKTLPETLSEFNYSNALSQNRVYGKSGLITSLTGEFLDVTDMPEVKAINSKLKGRFIGNNNGDAYYVSDKTIGQNGNDEGNNDINIGQFKDILMFDNSLYAIGTDGNMYKTNGIVNVDFSSNLSEVNLDLHVVPELEGKNVVSLMKNTNEDVLYATTDENDVYVFGNNNYGQLGLGSTDNQLSFVKNEYLSILKPDQISLASSHALAIKNGRIYGWGDNSHNQAMPPMLDMGTGAILPSADKLLQPTDHLNTISNINYNNIIFDGEWYVSKKGWDNGYFFYLDREGKLYSFGNNYFGQLGLGDDYDRLSLTEVTFFNDKDPIKEVYVAHGSTFVLTTDGKLYAFGYNECGQLGLGDTTNKTTPTEVTFFNDKAPIKEVYVEDCSTFVLTTDGKLYAFGYNDCGQLGLGDITERSTPTEVAFFNDKAPIKDVYFSGGSTFVLTTDEKLYAFGYNEYGQLGLGDTTDKSTPTEVTFFNDKAPVKEIYSLDGSTFVLTNDGKLYAFGRNSAGQLGLGYQTMNELTPTELTFFNDKAPIKEVYLGGYSTFVVTTDGKLYAFGDNEYGQLGLGDYSDKFTPQLVNIEGKSIKSIVIIDGNSTIAETNDGSMYVWGSDADLILNSSSNYNHTPRRFNQLEALNPKEIYGSNGISIIVKDQHNRLYRKGTMFEEDGFGRSYIYDFEFQPIPLIPSSMDGNVKRVFAELSLISTDNDKYYIYPKHIPMGRFVPQSFQNLTGQYPLYKEVEEFRGLKIKDVLLFSSRFDDNLYVLTEDGTFYLYPIRSNSSNDQSPKILATNLNIDSFGNSNANEFEMPFFGKKGNQLKYIKYDIDTLQATSANIPLFSDSYVKNVAYSLDSFDFETLSMSTFVLSGKGELYVTLLLLKDDIDMSIELAPQPIKVNANIIR